MSAQLASAEQSYVRPPVHITAERFDEMLNILPPLHWHGGNGDQSFKMPEFKCGDVTTIFCQIGTQHYELADTYRLTHREIRAKCAAIGS